ncbi:MAG: hypothetical protein ACE5KE_12045 [Methanosarcinales archaeon]
MSKKYILAAIVLIVTMSAFVAYANIGINVEDTTTDEATTDTTSYKYCFMAGSTKIEFNYDGKFIQGIATNPSCGSYTAEVLGDVHSGKFFMYRDWPSASSCVEGVWYTGDVSTKKYDWINTAGGNGTGTLKPCTSSSGSSAELNEDI